MSITVYWLGMIVLALYWIAVVVAIVAQDREPSVSLSWILILGLLPGVGLLIYLFGGRNWKGIHAKRQWVRDFRALQEPFMEPIYARYREYAKATRAKHAGTPTERLIRAISTERGNDPLPANEFAVCSSGEAYFPLLIDDISKAQRFIHMQYYEWEQDELTAKICDALAERVRAGVEVRILNDFLGCMKYKKDQLSALKAVGAHVGSDVTQLGRPNYRNHRKITVIDGVTGHSGGFNIGQEYIDGGSRYPSWRDTGMRLTGPAVAELQKLFAERWYEVFKESLFDQTYFPPVDIPVVESPVMTHIVAQGAEEFWSSSSRAHEIAISGAEKRVFIQSPYWVPDPTMLDVFMNAALSGIDLRFMMTGWPDRKLTYNAAQSYWEPVIKAGGHIYLYMAGFMHAKTIVVDGQICAVGTMNLDIRSLRLNKELMVWIYDEGYAHRQEEVFQADLGKCVEVTLEDIESWSTFRRFRNSASRLASSIL
ncbi:MAG: cardiolipin synthase [Actinomycetia bacterium]|nr:cardiolipin synthase [Actinomycetes bacterium]